MSLIENPQLNWGLFEWAATAASTLLAGMTAFIWKTLARLDRMDAALERVHADSEHTGSAIDGALTRLADRLAEIADEQSGLREGVAALPGRDDMRAIETRIGERFDALASRLDAAIQASRL